VTLGDRNDPLPAFNFVVQLIESGGTRRTVAGFSECAGLEATLEILEYQEGGVNDRVHKFPSRVTFGNLTLRRGLSIDSTLREWHYDVLRGIPDRRDGLIIVTNEQREPVLAWKFERGLPVTWTGPTLDASANEVAIETLEIAHERLEPVPL
jgi:phage tail-like protein